MQRMKEMLRKCVQLDLHLFAVRSTSIYRMTWVWDEPQDGQNRINCTMEIISEIRETEGKHLCFQKQEFCAILLHRFWGSCTYWIHNFSTFGSSGSITIRGAKILQGLQKQAENACCPPEVFSWFCSAVIDSNSAKRPNACHVCSVFCSSLWKYFQASCYHAPGSELPPLTFADPL